jgi:hypothetical protein
MCETELNLEKHHVLGASNRNNSEEDGLTIWLCMKHHRGTYSPHNNRKFDLLLKEMAQEKFEEHNTREAFILRYGRNYLE